MKIDLSQKLYNIQKESLELNGKKNVVLKDFLVECLLVTVQSDLQLTGKQKYDLGKLAEKVNNDENNFSVEELKTLKDRVGITFNQIVVSQVWDMLDQKENKETK